MIVNSILSSSRKAKGKEQAAKELEYARVAEEKETVSREYNDRLKQLRGQILRLAKEIDEEKAEREATEAEAPWGGLLDRAGAAHADSPADGGRYQPPRRGRRDRTGEYAEEP